MEKSCGRRKRVKGDKKVFGNRRPLYGQRRKTRFFGGDKKNIIIADAADRGSRDGIIAPIETTAFCDIVFSFIF